jgi:hypothetical protein
MSLPSSLSTEKALLDDSDEAQEEDEDMLLACLVVGEYLSETEVSPSNVLK